MFQQDAIVNEMPKLLKFASKLTRNSTEAQDLVQSTVLRALEKAEYFEDGTDLFKWTSKIMYNLFVTDYRRKTRWETQYNPETQITKAYVEPEQDDKAEMMAVAKAMEELSDEHKDVLLMVCVKGMRYEEVSELLQIPVGTVRSRLSRARDQLAAAMETPKILHPAVINEMSRVMTTH